MPKNLLKALVLVLVALTALAGAALSTVSAEGPQALATATAAPSDTAPAVQTPTPPRVAPPAAAINPLALLRRLGLDGGVVVANDGNTISVRRGRITGELQIASTTILVVPGIKNPQTSDVKVGDRVIANVPNNDTNSNPPLVLDFPKGYTTDNLLIGLVQLNASGTVTLRTRSGPQHITPNDSTVIVTILGDQPALVAERDIRRGDVAVVIGKRNGDQYDPQVIVVLDRAALQGNRKQN